MNNQKPKFTPGPWEITNNDDLHLTIRRNGYWAHSHIAYINGNVLLRDDGDFKANANLIAAAPDLYTSCEITLEQLSNFPTVDDISQMQKAMLIANLNAALSKARGEK